MLDKMKKMDYIERRHYFKENKEARKVWNEHLKKMGEQIDRNMVLNGFVFENSMENVNNKFNSTEYKSKFNKANYDTIIIRTKKGMKAKLKEYCKEQKISVNEYFNAKINKDIDKQ